MRLSVLKKILTSVDRLALQLEDGTAVPAHFHITEAGLTTKHFVDCGGTMRKEKYASMQVWVADDTDHRLSPKKLKDILFYADPLFESEDPEVEIEYQQDTIGRFGLDFSNGAFILTSKETDCLAKDQCGVPVKEKLLLSSLEASSNCAPGSGCC